MHFFAENKKTNLLQVIEMKGNENGLEFRSPKRGHVNRQKEKLGTRQKGPQQKGWGFPTGRTERSGRMARAVSTFFLCAQNKGNEGRRWNHRERINKTT